MNKKALIPTGISSLRIIALPIFLYFFSNGATISCIIVFGFSQITDLFDGYIARKVKATSHLGAYFDALADFVLITGIFSAFIVSNYYPAWILLLIAASFTQFIVSSLYTKKLYDPLGKYVGSVLYIAIGLTLLSPTPPIFTLVQIGFPAFALTSFLTRTVSLTINYRREHVLQQTKIKPEIRKPHN
jgi:CDP-diacylglycerol--glycerol-3-phosphate 3-phosphatidyltransferase/cardiolipin synthase